MLIERTFVSSLALATLIGVAACATPSAWKADIPGTTEPSEEIPVADTGVFTEETRTVAQPTAQTTEAIVQTPVQGKDGIEEVTVVGKSLPKLPVDICGLLKYADSGCEEGAPPRNEWSFYVERTGEKTTTICANKRGECSCREESSDYADLLFRRVERRLRD